jgi:hypothetical protein
LQATPNDIWLRTAALAICTRRIAFIASLLLDMARCAHVSVRHSATFEAYRSVQNYLF